MGKKGFRKFRLSWDKEVYGVVPDKIVTLRSITESQGFNKIDRVQIERLLVGQCWIESHPIGKGLRILRIK